MKKRQEVNILPADKPERKKLGWIVHEQQPGQSAEDFKRERYQDMIDNLDMDKDSGMISRTLTKIGWWTEYQLKDESDEDFEKRVAAKVEDINRNCNMGEKYWR